MYQAETEDLIPRCAPKPSSSGVNEAIVRPSVPEVSIVFSQPESLQSGSTPPTATTTYAAWKKQCLPQVVYPPNADISNAEFSAMSTRSNVYPMRTAAAVVPTINAAASQYSVPRSEQSGNIRRKLSVSIQQPCNMESPMAHCSPTYTGAGSCCKMNNQQRKSLDQVVHLQQQFMDTNILTICAGTQTDCIPINNGNELDIDNLATKEDIAQIKTMIVGMRIEQRRLMELIQNMAVAHSKTQNGDREAMKKPRDAATQCDSQASVGPLPQKRPHIKYDSIEEEDSTEEDDSYRFQKKTNVLIESPPKIQQFQPQAFRPVSLPRSDVVSNLPKPATEQSMVMNELALKYLPNEKLSELLQELHVSPVVQSTQKAQNIHETPLKNIENYGKSPSDLSTASFKYLKKYRLLSEEENNNVSPLGNVRQLNPTSQQENMLDLDTIRRQPKFM